MHKISRDTLEFRFIAIRENLRSYGIYGYQSIQFETIIHSGSDRKERSLIIEKNRLWFTT